MKHSISIITFLSATLNAQAPIIDYPEFETYTLSNGLKVMIAEHHENPAVFMNMMIEIGSMDVPIGKEGLGGIMSELVPKGTTAHSADEISAMIDATGGGIGASVGLEYSNVSGRFLAEDLGFGLNMMAELLQHATFPEEEFKLTMKQNKEGIKTWYSDPSSVASAHGDYLLLGETPMGRMTTEASLKSISLEDVKEFYNRIRPDISTLVLVGDFEMAAAKQLIESAFGNWTVEGIKQTRPDFGYPALNGLKFQFVDNPELDQATIYILHWGIPRKHEDRYAIRLANYIFGGGAFSSRLMEVVRGEGGKTYGVGSWIASRKDYGAFGIRTSTRNPEVYNTYQLIMGEIKRLRQEGVTEEELRKAKSFYTGSQPLSLESPGAIAGNILSALYYGFTIEDLETSLIRLNAVTLEEVNDAIREHYDEENMVLVIVGKGEEIKPLIAPIGTFDESFYKDDVHD
ncbi:MAG: pitrilysin family protein [Candidatus Marinimicrobia bacterium]|jgi:zinc protease|nr:pitrilysin family protein [Candidatus Neomarinimicrobiota bacterium]MDP6790096.1 pitrilysin family protein [Candidatus Neomarinimicrobiota bacterium]MDP7072359.1 pitrilysin family protein [Candidatus Neomarinimicrobiota bacterium]